MLASLLLTVAVFTFVLLLANAQDILRLLVGGQVRLGLLGRAIALLIPFAFLYALPMGLVTATLLTFGRFSADQELTAARASGVSLISLSAPVLVLSLVCCGISAWINLEAGPASRAQYKNILNEARSDLTGDQLPAGRLIYDFPGYIFLIDKNQKGNLENVNIWQYNDKTNQETIYAFAPSGKSELDPTNKQLNIILFNVQGIIHSTNGNPHFFQSATFPLTASLGSSPAAHEKPTISNMTFPQLQEELLAREKLLDFLPATTNSASEWRAQIKETEGLVEKVRSQMHEQVAFSFACFGFTLVGIPLGIRVHRRETNIGILMALVLVIVYYAFDVVGMQLSSRPEFFPHLIFWLPNFLFQAVGAVLLWRANKGI